MLGITDGVMAGAAVVDEGRILSAVNEERLCRLKMARGFPQASIREVLGLSGTSPDEISLVAVASTHEFYCPDVVPWNGWFQKDRGAISEAFRGFASEAVRLVGSSAPFQSVYYSLKKSLCAGRPRAIRARFRDELGIQSPVVFLDHHLCHAWSTYLTSGMEDCLVVSVDGGGDGLCARILAGKKGELTSLASIPAYDSIGNFYAYITHLAGFKAHRDEGKITGLAAHGRPIYRDILLSFISADEGTFRNRKRIYYNSALKSLRKALPSNFEIADLAASVQSVLESEMGKVVSYWARKTGLGKIALAGGVFANVRLNQRILELPDVESIFVFPARGDDGLAAGAALLGSSQEAKKKGDVILPSSLPDVFLGPSFTDEEIERTLKESGVPFKKVADPAAEMARLLAEDELVARFDGKMEYGPRALGHRSILYRPDDPSLQQWLNDALRRTEFMPFAPVTTEELYPTCFFGMEGAEVASRFMTVTGHCTEEFKRLCPGVVHVDGTARPQIVDPETDPIYAGVIREFHRLTGIPAIVNTSFNLHDEPIVHSPEDALRAWREVGILHLFLSGFLVPARTKRRAREGGGVVEPRKENR